MLTTPKSGLQPGLGLHAGHNSHLSDDISADEQRLAAELRELLSRRNLEFGEALRPAATILSVETSDGRGFAWQADDGSAVEDAGREVNDEPDAISLPSSTAAWLSKARRERRRARASRALAWLVTLLVAGAIIASAAMLLTGGDLALWRSPPQADPAPAAIAPSVQPQGTAATPQQPATPAVSPSGATNVPIGQPQAAETAPAPGTAASTSAATAESPSPPDASGEQGYGAPIESYPEEEAPGPADPPAP